MKTTSGDPRLLVGLEAPDDAAVYVVAPDVAIVQTVDFFTPVVDDARAWGRIAAANALSDVYAMGAKPVTALNLVSWPRELDFELLGRVLEGAGEACEEAGVAIVGGHSVDDPEPKFGLAVTGTVRPDAIVRKGGAPPGCDLVLTKPLGMGVISSAVKEGRAAEDTVDEAVAVMSELNAAAAEAMLEAGVSAATDVTGFGLLGHLLQMLDAGVSARLRWSVIPVIAEAVALAREGVLPGGSQRNMEAMSDRVRTEGIDVAQKAVLFDAQTSGGLLIAVPAARTQALLASLARRNVRTRAVIGSLERGDATVTVAPD